MNPNSRNVVLGVAAICLVVLLWGIATRPHGAHVSYSQFLQEVQSGKVASASIAAGDGVRATVKLKDGSVVRTVLPRDYRDAMAVMQDRLVDIEIREFSSRRLLLNATPFLLLLGFWIYAVRRLPAGGSMRWPPVP